MLRRPDSESQPDRFRRSRRRVLLIVAVMSIGLLVAARLSPLGVLFGALAGGLIIVFGMATGWFVTHILKIPRDGRGVHQRSGVPDEPID